MSAKVEQREFGNAGDANLAWTLAVDPGGTTGYSVANTDTGELLIAGQRNPFDFQEWLHFQADRLGTELTIVCERFTITQRTLKVSRGGSYDALEVIGTLRYFSLLRGGRDLAFQQPAEVMQLVSDARLKAMGWYQKALPHANDSLRHLAVWLAHRGVIDLPVL